MQPLSAGSVSSRRPAKTHRQAAGKGREVVPYWRTLLGAGDYPMSTIHWYELGSAALLVAFIVFAFKQGMKVRPLDPDEQPPVNQYVIPGQVLAKPPRIRGKSRLRGAGFVSHVLQAYFQARRRD